MTVKEELIHLVQGLNEDDAAALLEYTHWLLNDEDEELTSEEWAEVRHGEEQIASGQSITLDEFLRQPRQ